MANITFQHFGITAVLDDSVVSKAAMDTADGGDNASALRLPVFHDILAVAEDFTVADASASTTFTIGCGSVTIPNEVITESGKDSATIQAELNTLSDTLVAAYPA